MFELIFLGTSASAPSVHRGLSAHMIIYRQHRFLLDCGEGTQRQILQSGLGFKRLDKVLLTHAHLDHILGLGGFISTMSRWENLEKIDIYGGASTLRRVANLLFKVVFPGGRIPLELNLHDMGPGLLMEDDHFQLSAFPVVHRGPDCFGFLFNEKPHRPFLAEKAAALGVPFGPERAQLVRGEAVLLADGRTITPDDVLGPATPGTKYVHVGDVSAATPLQEICADADALVIESTYLDADAEMAAEFGHMTAGQAARLARESGVKTLILTHLSRRYHAREVVAEARAIFPATFVARDFDHYQISRKGTVRLKPETGSSGA
jgi:ribonuclease Z